MKTITRLLATAALLFGVVGGGTSVKAGNVFGHLTAEGGYGATWNAETETMGWNSVGNYSPNFRILATGLPSGDITEYIKFHATLSNFSDNATYVRLRIKSRDESSNQDRYADANLVAGENNIDLVALRAAYPDCDFTNVVDITIWSPGSAEQGKTVNADNPASVKIQNVYMQRVKNVASNSLVDEITDINYVINGGTFIMAKGSSIQAWAGNDPAALEKSLSDISNDLYYYLYAEELPALDVDEDGNPDAATYYRIGIKNGNGDVKPDGYYWSDNYMGYVSWGSLWSSTCAADKEKVYGRDGKFWSVWTIAYETGKGFKFYNPARNCYMTLTGGSATENFVKLYKSIELNINSELDKENNEADETIFDFANATGYDAETGTFTNGGWTFATPVDISNWDYIVLTTINNSSNVSCRISIADNDGKSVTGNQYTGSVAGTGGDMYLDQWNHQNAIRISVDYLRATKGLDVSKIKSLTFANNSGGDIVISIANVYLTDYENTKINGGYCEGDVKREYSETGKYGTICLPYKASYAGAEIYCISGKTSTGITLTKVTGLLEAGKPYFYMSADENGQNNAGTVRNVNFFRADLAKYDAVAPVANNGLIGTDNFEEMTAPAGSNYWILSGNKLYDTEGCTGTDAVTVGANKAYINTDLIVNAPTASRSAFIMFDEATGIKAVQGNDVTAKQEGIFNLNGQRLNQLKKGLNIVNGKKVMVK